ncbi:MAG TPA: CHAD domain-containing protein [Pseudolabrys sp.]|nr:CHAD domain-containing protein [Pseudolabrys sp.]
MNGANGRGGPGFGGHLAEAGRAMLADARRALEDPALSGAGRVHELRKAFKRWRAWLRLLAGPVGAPAETLRAEARTLMRGLSGARDAQAALDAIDDLARGTTSLSPRTLANIRTRLTALRDAAESASLTPQLKDAIAAYLARAGATIGGWTVDGIGFGTVADALTVIYRRARALAPGDWHQAEPAQLHELRRRVVEHRHQMELVEPLWPRLTKAWAGEAQRLRNRLGACQDLVVLAAFVAPHQPLAAWRSRLTPAIAARRAAHLKSASRLAGRLFAEKPKAFRGRIAALWTARKKRKAPPKKR